MLRIERQKIIPKKLEKGKSIKVFFSRFTFCIIFETFLLFEALFEDNLFRVKTTIFYTFFTRKTKKSLFFHEKTLTQIRFVRKRRYLTTSDDTWAHSFKSFKSKNLKIFTLLFPWVLRIRTMSLNFLFFWFKVGRLLFMPSYDRTRRRW